MNQDQIQPQSFNAIDIAPDLEALQAVWADFLRSEFSTATREAHIKGVRIFIEWSHNEALALTSVTAADMHRWRDQLKESHAVQSVNLWLSSVRRFYAWLIEIGAPITNPAAGVRGASHRGQSRRQKRDDRTALWIYGKGRVEADDFIVLPPPAEAAMRSRLRERERRQGALFWSLSNQNRKARMTSRAIRGMIKERFHRAGVVSGG